MLCSCACTHLVCCSSNIYRTRETVHDGPHNTLKTYNSPWNTIATRWNNDGMERAQLNTLRQKASYSILALNLDVQTTTTLYLSMTIMYDYSPFLFLQPSVPVLLDKSHPHWLQESKAAKSTNKPCIDCVHQ